MIQDLALLFLVIINVFLGYLIFIKGKSNGNKNGVELEKKNSNQNKIDKLDPSQINALHDFDNIINKLNGRITSLENINRDVKSKLNKLEGDNNSFVEAFKILGKKIDSKSTTEKVKETDNEVHARDAVRDEKIEKKPYSQSNSNKKYADEKPTVVEFEVPKQETIFLPSPFERNKFSVEDASQNEKQESLYVIKLDVSSDQTGTISILENADFAKALNSPQQFLELVCDYENSFTNLARRVENVSLGEVKREGYDWVVTKRILIKFI